MGEPAWRRSWGSGHLMRDAELASSFDKSVLLSMQLRRQERKRQLVYFGAIKDDDHSDNEHTKEDASKYEDKLCHRKNSVESSDKTSISSSHDLSPSESPSSWSITSSTSSLLSQPSSSTMEVMRELEQWLRKMRCSGQTGQQLEHFSDINVGPCPEPVRRHSPSLEPYNRLRDVLLERKHKYEGGRDERGLPNGRGVLELSNGDIVSGTFHHGQRQGLCRVECTCNDLKLIVGNYHKDRLQGKAKLVYESNEWLDAYFVDGVLHGFARRFDANGYLKFVGNFRNGRPSGVCWLLVRHGGYVVGHVDSKSGHFTSTHLAYLYPDLFTALVGSFEKGVLQFGQRSFLTNVVDEPRGLNAIKMPHFTRPEGPLYRREVATTEWMTNWPLLPDPYESRMVEVRQSKVNGAGEGLFCRQDVEANTVLAFYNGQRIAPRSFADFDHQDWNLNAYKIFDPTKPSATIDIPVEFRELGNYTASLAHKTNHSFCPNAEIVTFEHPRFGLVPAIMATHSIAADEEIFVHYGYELSGCPDWYEAGWMKGDYPIPDSMRALYSVDNKESKEEHLNNEENVTDEDNGDKEENVTNADNDGKEENGPKEENVTNENKGSKEENGPKEENASNEDSVGEEENGPEAKNALIKDNKTKEESEAIVKDEAYNICKVTEDNDNMEEGANERKNEEITVMTEDEKSNGVQLQNNVEEEKFSVDENDKEYNTKMTQETLINGDFSEADTTDTNGGEIQEGSDADAHNGFNDTNLIENFEGKSVVDTDLQIQSTSDKLLVSQMEEIEVINDAQGKPDTEALEVKPVLEAQSAPVQDEETRFESINSNEAQTEASNNGTEVETELAHEMSTDNSENVSTNLESKSSICTTTNLTSTDDLIIKTNEDIADIANLVASAKSTSLINKSDVQTFTDSVTLRTLRYSVITTASDSADSEAATSDKSSYAICEAQDLNEADTSNAQEMCEAQDVNEFVPNPKNDFITNCVEMQNSFGKESQEVLQDSNWN